MKFAAKLGDDVHEIVVTRVDANYVVSLGGVEHVVDARKLEADFYSILYEGKSYEVSAETIEPAQVNFIRRDDFVRFITENVEACMHTAEQLSDRYHSAQKEIRAFGLAQTTAERLARLLIDWCDTKGEDTPQGTRVQVLLTHEEIAQMIGTSRETVTRLLSDLKKKKIIEVKGASVYIKNRDALDDMVTV
jgi:CRP/FNR family transcriptional regulator